MVTGLVTMAFGSLLFVPAALTRTYGLFLTGLFVQGAGMALLQTASNPYVTILGPIESAAKRISIMGICNGVAGVLAPAILGFVTLAGADEIMEKVKTMTATEKAPLLDMLASRVILPYLFIMAALLLLSLFLYFSNLPDIDHEEENAVEPTEGPEKTNVFQFPHLLLGVLAIFLYTGVEVIAGNTIISYGVYLNIPISTAKFFSSFTIFAMLVGYVIGIIIIPKYLSQNRVLTISAMLGVLFALAAIFTTGFVSVMFIGFLGFANSLMWPSIWPLAITKLGRFTKTGSSMMVMAISGAAVVPLLYGYLADITSARLAYWIVIPIYCYILFYATIGHLVGRQRSLAGPTQE
jgi:MFS transporter, FHS family, L-fucose permease